MCFCRGVDDPYDLVGEFISFEEEAELATRAICEVFEGTTLVPGAVYLVEGE